MQRGLYLHNVNTIANKVYLGHLKKYNMEWGIPVSPEGRRKDFSLFGDTYSNFNAGNIDIMLEGIGGFYYNVLNSTFTHSETLPDEWTFMEFYVPIRASKDEETKWVHTYVSRNEVDGVVYKNVSVESDYFENINVKPWTEDISKFTS